MKQKKPTKNTVALSLFHSEVNKTNINMLIWGESKDHEDYCLFLITIFIFLNKKCYIVFIYYNTRQKTK